MPIPGDALEHCRRPRPKRWPSRAGDVSSACAEIVWHVRQSAFLRGTALIMLWFIDDKFPVAVSLTFHGFVEIHAG